MCELLEGVDIDEDRTAEAYSVLKTELTRKQKNEGEAWYCMAKVNNKTYAVYGDGALTSDGDAVFVEVDLFFE